MFRAPETVLVALVVSAVTLLSAIWRLLTGAMVMPVGLAFCRLAAFWRRAVGGRLRGGLARAEDAERVRAGDQRRRLLEAWHSVCKRRARCVGLPRV